MGKKQTTPIVVNDVEYMFEDMTEEQQTIVNHCADLDRKIKSAQFNIDQLSVGKDAFVNMLTASLETAEEEQLMLAELAAANAAFQVIKTAISNGKELYDCSDAAKKYFDNKSTIAKRVASKGKSDLDAFMALEKIKEQEVWLKDYMVYAGRAEMYTDWLNYQAECKRKREKKERLAAAQRRENLKLIKQFITIMGTALAVLPVLIYVFIYLTSL